ncbi:MAG: amino acid synthesis family protein [Rhizobiales bacterium]|nr:amino acid synthesis family protein [Hyphomicrobiales bacterium]
MIIAVPTLAIRRQFVLTDIATAEAGLAADRPLVKVAVVVILNNPFAGKPFTEDLSPLIAPSATLGSAMAAAAVAAMGGAPIESYGKGAVVGLNGEQEHGIALITTPFGDALRAGIGGGQAWISSFSKRAAPGTVIDVPLAHKDALYVRSHYDGISVHLPDAPLPDEIAILAAFASRGRLNARLGGVEAAEIVGEDGLR